jgi:subtilisin family serine protease
MKKILASLSFVLLASLLFVPLRSGAQTAALSTAPDAFKPLRSYSTESVSSGDPDLAKVNSDTFSARNGRVKVVIELEDEPATLTLSRLRSGASEVQAANAAQAQVNRIDRVQQALLPSLSSLNAQVIYRVQRVYNGIAVSVDRSKLVDIARLPGVKTIRPLNTKYLDNTTAVPLLGSPQIWESLGVTGEGITVGVIDTGIDYLHASFGGPGTVEAFNANDTRVVTDTLSTTYFGPGKKVAGGTDFVGDLYDADCSAANKALGLCTDVPAPDPDPIDCVGTSPNVGHGTHVAGTAAGFGVTNEGETFTGPYTGTLDLSEFKIGPGSAPEATLYALRVFGCDGSTDVTDLAIEWAMDPNGDGNMSDHLDVINMSLGSVSGDENDTSAIASNNAAAAGVIVVATSGNEGDTYYNTGSPAVATRALSVAGNTDAGSVRDAFRVNTPAELAGLKPASFSVNFNWLNFTSAITASLYYSSTLTSCAAYSDSQKAAVNGKIILIDWRDGQCGSGARANNAQAAGAVGLIIADDSEAFDLFLAGNATLPTLSTSRQIGAQLKAATGDVSVTLSGTFREAVLENDPAQVDTVYSSSSRGPRRDDSFLKPDITAPAVSVYSTFSGSGNKGQILSGTSMAAPNVAGMMALLRQVKGDEWTVEELKALAMNTATADIFTGFNRTGREYGPGRQGTGRAEAFDAATNNVIAYNAVDAGAVSVSFGYVEVLTGTTVTATKPVKIVNKGDTAASYLVGFDPRVDQSGVSYSLSTTNVTVPANSSTTISVTMTAVGSQMTRGSAEATTTSTQGGLPRHYIAEEAGYLQLTPAGDTINLVASLNAAQEVQTPAVVSNVTATAVMTYNTATRALDYNITFSAPITTTMGHLHRGIQGVNGPVAVGFPNGAGSYGPTAPLTGTVTIPENDVNNLLTGGFYINLHTATYPGGEIRGQVGLEDPFLRVAVHSVPRLSADMTAAQATLNFSQAFTATGAISLTGVAVDTPSLLSVVTAFELQGVSPKTTTGYTTSADLAYIGAYSDIASTATITNPTGVVSETTVYFGIATHADWTTPEVADVEFDIYIDTDGSGFDANGDGAEYILLNGSIGLLTGGDSNNVYASFLIDLETGDLVPSSFLNVASAQLDTGVFNTNVMVLPVTASELGLSGNQSQINYYVVSFERTAGQVDISDVFSYDLAEPGIIFDETDNLLAGPAYADVPGTLPFAFDRKNFYKNDSVGILLMHHHNKSGDRVNAITINNVELNHLPMIRR